MVATPRPFCACGSTHFRAAKAHVAPRKELCGSPWRLYGTCSWDTYAHIVLQTWPRLARAQASALQDMAAVLLPWPGPHGTHWDLHWHHMNSPM